MKTKDKSLAMNQSIQQIEMSDQKSEDHNHDYKSSWGEHKCTKM